MKGYDNLYPFRENSVQKKLLKKLNEDDNKKI